MDMCVVDAAAAAVGWQLTLGRRTCVGRRDDDDDDYICVLRILDFLTCLYKEWASTRRGRGRGE